VLLLFVTSLLLQGCESPGEKRPRSEPLKLKVVVLPFLSFAPFFIAEEEGYFTDQGLEVEFVKMGKPAGAIPALVQGKLDVSTGAISVDKLNAMARGAKIRFVAGKGYLSAAGCTYDALLARRALVEAGELDSPAQLRGRRLSIPVTLHPGYIVDKLLSTVGLTFNDVENKDLPEPAIVEAFETAAIDVASMSEPWITRLLQGGYAVIWMPAQQVIPDFQLGVIIYGPNLLEENPDAGKRFMVAYLQGVRQYTEGKTARNLAILVEHTGLERELLMQACWPPIHDDGRINVQSVLDFQSWAVEKGYLDSLLTQEQFFDPSFVEYANQVLEASSR
jgi:NitT/TauT family transport system substrate-binding protein